MASSAVAPTLSGVQKAAILLVALGDQASSSLLKELSPEHVKIISSAVVNLPTISAPEAEAVLEEFLAATTDALRVGYGGIAYAKRILTGAFGPEGSKQHLDRLSNAEDHGENACQLQDAEPQLLARFVKNEHPQTVAIILSQLNPAQSATVLASMPLSAQPDVATRIAKLGKISPAVIAKVSTIISQKLRMLGESKRQPLGGPRAVAEIFKQMDSQLSNEILALIGEKDSEMVESIRQKMFVFDDLLGLDANGVKELLSRADRRNLTIALKGTSDELRQHLLKGMSQRGAAMLLEDMEALGPVKIREVEAAQLAIIAAVRQLEDEGVLNLGGANSSDDQFVV